MTEFEKFRQIKKEAAGTGLALVALIIFWCIAGFGLSSSTITVFSLPLWSVTGTVGVWIFAIVMVWLMIKFLFKDMDLGETSADTKEENIS